MKERRAKRIKESKKHDLPRYEWDFGPDRVKNEHLWACVEWEYSRTLPKYIEAVQNCRRGYQSFMKNNLEGFFFESDLYGLYRVPPQLHFEEWPKTPFVSLSDGVRDIFAADVNPDKDLIYGPREEAMSDSIAADGGLLIERVIEYVDNNSLPIAMKRWDLLKDVSPSEAYQFAAFAIDWTFSDDQLVKRFQAWLKRRRPNVQVVENRGAGGDFRKLRQSLKELGAFRLLKNMSFEAASLFTAEVFTEGTVKKSKGLYGDHPKTWKKASREAESRLREMEKTRISKTFL